jgi:glycosyltransferase involved in cell wall biosynthesis
MPHTDQPVVEPSGLGLPLPGPSLNGNQKVAPELSVEVATARRRQSEANSVTPAPLPSPRVSVLIPTYNYGRFLPEAIESVLGQEFQDYEVVIVDDCSQDESEEVIRRYAARDGRIRFHFNRPNLGMVANWNYCLSLARGEYVQFLFGDDKLADRQALAKMVRLLEANPSAVLAAAARNIIDDNSEVIEVSSHLGASGLHTGFEVIIRCLEKNANIVGEPSVVMMRRKDALRGFNPEYRQLPDLEMWFYLLERGNAIYTTEPLYSFRKHALQQTAVNRINQVGERESMFLLADYYGRPWLKNWKSRKFLFSQIYWIRRGGGYGEGSKELEARIMKSLGEGWYFWFWMLRKLGRPFSNLRRFYLKHILRRAVK